MDIARNIPGVETRDLELQPADIFFAPPDNAPPLNVALVNQVLADTTAVIMEYKETTNWVYGRFVSTNTE